MHQVASRGRQWPVYTKNEALEQGIGFQPWKLAQTGGYALSDDGLVAQVVKRYDYPGKSSLLVFPEHKVWASKYGKLLLGTPPPTWHATESKKGRGKRVAKIYAKMILSGKIDFNMLGNVYRPDQAIPAATVRRLIKSESMVTMIDEALNKELKEVGIDPKWVIEKLKAAVLMAEAKLDPNAMLRGTEQASKLLDMLPKESKHTAVLEYSVDKELFSHIQDVGKQLEAQAQITEHAEGADPEAAINAV